MSVTTTCQKDGQILGLMRIRVTEVAAEDNGRIVQQTRTEFSRPLHLLQQAAEATDNTGFDLLKLPDLGGVLPMMR